MFEARVLQVFVASPGDLGPSRAQVVDELTQWNRNHAKRELVMFVPLAWEWAVAHQAGPGVDGGGQEEINRQQLKDADVVIGMFKHRLGQPTKTNKYSGTAEEIAFGVTNGAYVGILVDGQDEGATSDLGAMAERLRLDEYLKSELYPNGLVQEFSSSHDLTGRVQAILWKACEISKVASPTEPTETPAAHDLGELAQALSSRVVAAPAQPPAGPSIPIQLSDQENWSVELRGVVDFDYRDYDGDYYFGEPGRTFHTRWSAAGDDSIHSYGDLDDTIIGVALVERFGEQLRKGEVSLNLPVQDFRSMNYTSRRRTAHVDDMLVFLRPDGEILTVLIEIATRRTDTTSPRLRARYQIARIDGELPPASRTAVKIDTSTRDSDGDYYPRIDEAHDSLGNQITAIPGVDGEFLGVVPPIGERADRLQPGAVITFTGIATDPQGRDLEWSCAAGVMDDSVRKTAHSGAGVTFTWTVGTDDVASTETQVLLQIRSIDARYHRTGSQSYGYDHRVHFRYVVDRLGDDQVEVAKSLV